jgi:hypothetical protein
MGRINSIARFERFNAYLTKTGQNAPATWTPPATWKEFDQLFLTTLKVNEKGNEETRFQQVISKLASGETAPLETKADAPVESAKPRKARKGTPAPEASWPLATEAAATIADKASSPLLQALEPEPAPAPTAIHVAGYHAPVPDAVAARRAKWAIAKRASRALAKAKVQWRGDPERTAAAGAE